MKTNIRTCCLALAGLLLAVPAVQAQTYSLNWFTVAGGGGTSAGGTYQVTGTIGQPAAGGPLTGGSYSLTGGFWSLLSVVETPGLPSLTIRHAGSTVLVSWPNTGAYVVQQNTNLAVAAGWVASGYPVTTANGTNSIALSPPVGRLFFRLARP